MLESEPKKLDAWSWSLTLEFWFPSPDHFGGSNWPKGQASNLLLDMVVEVICNA